MNAKERNDLIISWITLSIAFSLVISDNFLNLLSLADAIPIAFIGVGTGFIFHEIAHRNVARKFGFHSEYRAWNHGLMFAILFAVISGGRFTFAAPGVTYIFAPSISREQNGVISIAGPAANIVLGFLLLFLSLLVPDLLIFKILFNAALINFFLAFFNLLPIPPLDGIKVMNWNMAAWVAVITISGVMAFFPQLLLALLGLI